MCRNIFPFLEIVLSKQQAPHSETNDTYAYVQCYLVNVWSKPARRAAETYFIVIRLLNCNCRGNAIARDSPISNSPISDLVQSDFCRLCGRSLRRSLLQNLWTLSSIHALVVRCSTAFLRRAIATLQPNKEDYIRSQQKKILQCLRSRVRY